MTSPIVDLEQRELFLKEAARFGYQAEEFGFVGRTAAEGRHLIHRAIISRGRHSREYPHGDNIRWVGDALKDLLAGRFGAPVGAKTWTNATLIPDGPFRGMWAADAYFTLGDDSRVEFSAPNRMFNSEAEALKAAKQWLDNHLKVNTAK